jgi:hypothetical protein
MDFLKGLPLLLAGPVLRRTEPDAVTVWMALKRPCNVMLQVLKTRAQGTLIDSCVLQGQRETAELGAHLHVVAVTARSLDGKILESDRLYAYDLQFAIAGEDGYSLTAALESGRRSPKPISYFTHQKPTFVLPPAKLADLKIIHGSCRKPHGAGFDALPIVDSLVATAAGDFKERPHQLFLTGDQIYGDDVADPLLWLATSLGDSLLGWEESLPVHHPSDPSTAKQQPNQLLAGQRADVATRRAGLTAGLKGKHAKVTSHLFSFSEYCAAYLLAHSPACWPESIPAGNSVTKERKAARIWNRDKHHMEQFLHSLWKVRRLLANVSTYTIFDDHDVSDDWNLNQAWCLRVLGRPLGRRTVQNAMLAYAVFQAWGNTPWQFEGDQSGAALLTAVQTWSASAGKDETAELAIATYLGLPPADPHTGLPQFVEDKNVWIFKRAEKALTWHYTVRSACHEVIVLDTRTWRGYPIEAEPIAPPMLLCPQAFQQQVAGPLSQFPDQADQATFIVAPTNVFGMRVLDWIQKWHLNQRKVFSADVGDSWNLHHEALATLLTLLFKYRQDVVVLSGDIHYSSAIQVSYQNFISNQQATLTQLTASAIKNEELLTQILHTRLKQWLLPEKPRHWVGWSSPPNMVELPAREIASPDWRCHMHWLKRQSAQPLTVDVDELVPRERRVRTSVFKGLRFWKTRWFQSGQEVVGVNNIALVHFQPAEQPTEQPADAANAQSSLTVAQDHYWFSPWSPTQVVRSRFQ